MPIHPENKRFTHQAVLVALTISLILILYTLQPFVDAFFGSIILYVLFRPLMHRFVDKLKWKRTFSALLIIIIAFSIVLVPILLMSYMIIPKLYIFFSEGSVTMNVLIQADERIYLMTGFHVITPDNISKLQSEATTYITGFLGETMLLLTNILLLFFILYFMLINTGKNETFLNQYLPFNDENIGRFSTELESQTFSNALGAPLLAMVQALAAALGYWIFGLPDPLFWGVMTGFFSFIPVAGTLLIWLPATIYQISSGYTWQGIAIAIYGIAIIGSIDNVFRMIFLKKFADIHPLITIIGVITGLQLFGVSGIIFGPLLFSYFIILLKIFKEEFLSSGQA